MRIRTGAGGAGGRGVSGIPDGPLAAALARPALSERVVPATHNRFLRRGRLEEPRVTSLHSSSTPPAPLFPFET